MATKFIENFISNQSKPYNTDIIVDNFHTILKPLKTHELTDILISDIYIPDYYTHDSSEETLFTKLVEVFTSFIFNRIGIESEYLKVKSGTEDIHLSLNNKEIDIVGDVKTYRLGRSQKAANVKDFVKPADFQYIWGSKYSTSYGLVIFPSTHEWKKESDVYQHSTNPNYPIVLMHFSHLAVLLNYYSVEKCENISTLWDYSNLKIVNSKSKENYWTYFNSNFLKLFKNYSIDIEKILLQFEEQIQKSIKEIICEYSDLKTKKAEEIKNEIEKMNEAEVKKLAEQLLIKKNIEKIETDIERIEKFRLIK